MILRFFEEFPEIYAGTTTRLFDNTSTSFLTDDNEIQSVLKRRNTIIESENFNKIIIPKLQHGSQVINTNDLNFSLEADALITSDKNTLIGVTTADCIPVFLYDPQKIVIGVVHSGWRGVQSNITEKTLQRMHQDFNCCYKDIYIQIGPHICSKCYEVGQEVLEQFSIDSQKEKDFLNMESILIKNVLLLGINRSKIFTNNYCTLCYKKNNQQVFFSHRNRDKERMLSFIGIR